MIMLAHVRATADSYLTGRPDEHLKLAPLRRLLNAGEDVTSRKTLDGHVTASAVVLNAKGQVLLIRHRASGKLLQPGGHLEPEDTSLIAAALREAGEELGIPVDALEGLHPWQLPDHIDVHTIPANQTEGEPEHIHIDFRFTFRLTREVEIELQEEEVSDWGWYDPSEIADGELGAQVRYLVESSS